MNECRVTLSMMGCVGLAANFALQTSADKQRLSEQFGRYDCLLAKFLLVLFFELSLLSRTLFKFHVGLVVFGVRWSDMICLNRKVFLLFLVC